MLLNYKKAGYCFIYIVQLFLPTMLLTKALKHTGVLKQQIRENGYNQTLAMFCNCKCHSDQLCRPDVEFWANLWACITNTNCIIRLMEKVAGIG